MSRRWSLEFLKRLTEEVGTVSLKGKIPTESLIAQQILRCQMALVPEERYEHIQNLCDMIPESWEDDKFKEDMEEAYYSEEREVPHKWCGVKVTKNPNLPPRKVLEEGYYWEKVFKACWNLFDRLGLLLKKQHREVQTGIRFDDARDLAREIIEKGLPEEAEE